jgi:hypothetical protein
MHTDTPDPLRRALAQRDQAVACAILCVLISISLILNTFMGHQKQLQQANVLILNLQNQLSATQSALRANEQELIQTQEALSRATQRH